MFSLSAAVSPCAALIKPRRASAARTTCSSADAPAPAASVHRRTALAAAAVFLLRVDRAGARPAFEAGDGADVSAYLPDASEDGFVAFRPSASKTPALRSGTIDPTAPYTFSLSKNGRWKEAKVANAISGNYCQPSCDEPTTEVIFSSPKQGKVSVIICPLTKVTRLVSPQVSDVGSPEQLIASFGPYITGDSIDVASDVVSAVSQTIDSQVYYIYELFTPTALSGAHNLAALTFKGGVSLLCIASANEKQWDDAKKDLLTTVSSFRIGQKA